MTSEQERLIRDVAVRGKGWFIGAGLRSALAQLLADRNDHDNLYASFHDEVSRTNQLTLRVAELEEESRKLFRLGQDSEKEVSELRSQLGRTKCDLEAAHKAIAAGVEAAKVIQEHHAQLTNQVVYLRRDLDESKSAGERADREIDRLRDAMAELEQERDVAMSFMSHVRDGLEVFETDPEWPELGDEPF